MGKQGLNTVEQQSVAPTASKFPLSFWEATVASTVALVFAVGLLGVYLTMPDSDYSFLKLPRTLEDLQLLRSEKGIWVSGDPGAWNEYDNIRFYKPIDAILPRKGPITRTMSKRLQEDWARAAEEGPRVLMNLRISELLLSTKFRALLSLSLHSSPSSSKLLSMASYGGTVFMSLLAGALFGVFKGVALVVFTATAGASSCYFLSKLIGRPILSSLWPEKLKFFQTQVAKRRKGLLNYMLFLRLTPTLPNTFINFASPIVDVPYHIFFLATVIGLIPAAYVTVKAGLALGELQSVGDLYDFNSIATLFLIGVVSVTPTLISKNES
ncbi:putative membrane protein isoform B [Glycine soja]|uniref:Putative membrane protein isoform B n=1 Tax=Glycine soja TaxID=3848 RepID=A0A445J3W2_GLYSO|nr:putative membrane protein isoform B [Glycine soja]